MIYLDTNATTKCHSDVINAMAPYFSEKYGNASSKYYSLAIQSQNAHKNTSEAISSALGIDEETIYYTSGATESNNIVICGVVEKLKDEYGKKFHIITTGLEHKSVFEAFTYYKENGMDVTLLEPNEYGEITPDIFHKAIKDTTKFVSLMWVNNEIGSITNIEEIANICDDKNILLHSDLTQGILKLNINLEKTPLNFASFSGHKIYGPKGIGGLYIKKFHTKFLKPISFGGGQSGGVRSGTFNTPGIVGLGKAFEVVSDLKKNNYSALLKNHDFCIQKLKECFPDMLFNVSSKNVVPGCVSFCLPDVSSDAIIFSVKDKICIASGSACTAEDLRPSHVLKALGYNNERARNSFRISFGYDTTQKELEVAIKTMESAVNDSKLF